MIKKATSDPVTSSEDTPPYRTDDNDGGVATQEEPDTYEDTEDGDDDDSDDESQAQLDLEDEEIDRTISKLDFKSPEEIRVTRAALRCYVRELRKNQKKELALEQNREAKMTHNTAELITDQLLPQLETKQKDIFDEQESLPDAVSSLVGQSVRASLSRGIQGMTHMEGESPEDMQERRKELIDGFETVVGNIAEITAASVIPLLKQVALRSYKEGERARTITADALVREAVQFERDRRSA